MYQIQTGISGSSFSYNEFYRYFTLQPYIKFTFNKEDKRSQKNSFINLRYIAVDKEIPFGEEKSPQDQYKLFAAQYQYNEPNIINRFRSKIGVELANSFQKIYTDIQFRKLTYSKRYFEVRLFGGFFLNNQNSNDSNYFNFGLNTTNDYLFEHAILARSNNDGFISQQFINTEGGFKSNSFKDNAFANQWMGTLNTSFSLLSRIELYNNVGFSKSKNEPVFFGYESGLRLNLAENILEFYFPLYNNYGWEFEQGPYSEKIRFVLQFNPQKLLQIFRRGWF